MEWVHSHSRIRYWRTHGEGEEEVSSVEELKEVVSGLVTTAYQAGLAMGSGSDVFLGGETYSLSDLTAMYREQGAKVDEILSRLEGEVDGKEG